LSSPAQPSAPVPPSSCGRSPGRASCTRLLLLPAGRGWRCQQGAGAAGRPVRGCWARSCSKAVDKEGRRKSRERMHCLCHQQHHHGAYNASSYAVTRLQGAACAVFHGENSCKQLRSSHAAAHVIPLIAWMSVHCPQEPAVQLLHPQARHVAAWHAATRAPSPPRLTPPLTGGMSGCPYRSCAPQAGHSGYHPE
jgi:hypothetical protein